MILLEINSWNPGLQKILLTRTLQATMQINLKDAKSITDRTLYGASSVFRFENIYDAQNVSHELENIGVITRILQFEEPNPEDDYALSVARRIMTLLETSIDKNRRLIATQNTIGAIATEIGVFSQLQKEHLLRFLDIWQDQRSMFDYPIPKEEETQDWFEEIISTLRGMLEESR